MHQHLEQTHKAGFFKSPIKLTLLVFGLFCTIQINTPLSAKNLKKSEPKIASSTNGQIKRDKRGGIYIHPRLSIDTCSAEMRKKNANYIRTNYGYAYPPNKKEWLSSRSSVGIKAANKWLSACRVLYRGRDQKGRRYVHPAINVTSCSGIMRQRNSKYITENYGYAYPPGVVGLIGSSESEAGSSASIKWIRDCQKLCWRAPQKPPLGGGWHFIGNYGYGSAEKCSDTYVKLLDRRAGRIEVTFAAVNRMEQPTNPSRYSRSSQIRCSDWSTWESSVWAPIPTNTRLDYAAKKFC